MKLKANNRKRNFFFFFFSLALLNCSKKKKFARVGAGKGRKVKNFLLLLRRNFQIFNFRHVLQLLLPQLPPGSAAVPAIYLFPSRAVEKTRKPQKRIKIENFESGKSLKTFFMSDCEKFSIFSFFGCERHKNSTRVRAQLFGRNFAPESDFLTFPEFQFFLPQSEKNFSKFSEKSKRERERKIFPL